ncbi:MAG: hypothetical protein ACLRXQ_04065 [Phascolarctobacterium faecium]
MLVKECERRIDKTQEGGEGYLLFFDIDGFKRSTIPLVTKRGRVLSAAGTVLLRYPAAA